METPAATSQAFRQTCVLCASHYQKEPDEKNKKAPVHFFVYQMRVARTCDQHDGCSHCGDQRWWEASKKSGQNEYGYQPSLDQSCAVNLHRIDGSFGLDIVNTPTEIEPPEYEPIQKQADERDGT